MISCITGTAIFGEAVPARLLAHLNGRPSLDVREQQHDRARLLVDLVVLLALDVSVRGNLVRVSTVAPSAAMSTLPKLRDRHADIDGLRSRSGTGTRRSSAWMIDSRGLGPAAWWRRSPPAGRRRFPRTATRSRPRPRPVRRAGRRVRRPPGAAPAWPTTDLEPSRLVTPRRRRQSRVARPAARQASRRASATRRRARHSTSGVNGSRAPASTSRT